MPQPPSKDQELLAVFNDPNFDLSALSPEDQHRLVELTTPKPPSLWSQLTKAGARGVAMPAALAYDAWQKPEMLPVIGGGLGSFVSPVIGMGMGAAAGRGAQDIVEQLKSGTPKTAGQVATDIGVAGAEGAAFGSVPVLGDKMGSALLRDASKAGTSSSGRGVMAGLIDYLFSRNPMQAAGVALGTKAVTSAPVERALGNAMRTGRFLSPPTLTDAIVSTERVPPRPRSVRGRITDLNYRMPGGVSGPGVTEAELANTPFTGMRPAPKETIGEGGHFGEAGNLPPDTSPLPHPGVEAARGMTSRGGDPVAAANRVMGTSPTRFKRPQVYGDINEILGELTPSRSTAPELPASWQALAESGPPKPVRSNTVRSAGAGEALATRPASDLSLTELEAAKRGTGGPITPEELAKSRKKLAVQKKTGKPTR